MFIASFGAQQAQIVKQLRDNGVSQQLASYSAFSSPTVTQLPEAKGALFPTQSVDWAAAGMSERVAKDWKAKTGKEPNAYVANYYNAVMVFVKLAQALEKSGQPITGENLLKQRKATGTLRSRRRQDGRSCPTARSSMPIQINEIDGGGGGKLVKGATDGEVARSTVLLLQLVINGLQLGAIYALTAVGFSLIFGSTKIFHVAHGAAFTIAAYLYWWTVYGTAHALAGFGADCGRGRGGVRAVHGAVHLSADPAP